MSTQTKSILFLFIIAVLIAVFAFMKSGNESGKSSVNNSTESDSEKTIAVETKDTKKHNTQSIASEWRWEEFETKDSEEGVANELFTVESVHAALQAVEIDEYGDLVLDNKALFALDEALERIHAQLDADSLQALLDVIKDALPGKIGEQTAQLVEDYHGFLGAQAEFNQLHQYTNTGPQTVASLEQDRGLYAELQTLRELHLGTQTAQSLFQEVNANADFMFDMLSLDLETNLSPEEIAKRRAEIQARYEEKKPPSP